MKKQVKDYIYRIPIKAAVRVGGPDHEHGLELPEGFILENGILTFPAGHEEGIVVEGKDYGIASDGKRLDTQKELVTAYLVSEGYDEAEAREFLDDLPTEIWSERFLSFDESKMWLKKYPEAELNALNSLKKARELLEQKRSEAHQERKLR